MRILIITTKRVSSTQLKEFNKHYAVLSVGKAHLKKRIQQLGTAELMILNLNFGMLHSPAKNEELKWINSQDLSGFNVVYVYSKPKYMKSFVKANLVLRALPLTIGKTLGAVLAMSERMADGESSVSLTQDELKCITEEVKHDVTADDIIDLMNKYKQLQRDYARLEEVCDKLRESAVTMLKEPEPNILKRQDNVDGLNDVISKLAEPKEVKTMMKPVKSLKHGKNEIRLLSDGVVIDILKYCNRREQRTAQRTSMQWMRE
jgi:hypothetical protein